MKALLLKTNGGLRGATEADHAAWTKFRRKLETIKPGSYLRLEFSSPRNGAHHRKFFALLQAIAECHETYNTVEKALVAVKMMTGYVDSSVHPMTGELVMIPMSISFDSMGQEDFNVFYNQAVDMVLKHVLTDMDDATLERIVQMICG